jgi:putative heme-binding domain-containing protein
MEASSGSRSARIGAEFLKIDWPREVRKGNAANGRKLFGALACAKCKEITAGQQGGGAPSLAGAGRRFTVPYLVESILLPGNQVAEVYRSTLIVTKKGQSFSGLVVKETADQVELLLPDAERRTFAKKDIDRRKVLKTSPMPAGLVKKPSELRDLLAYLVSKNPLPP